jgi:hypothetical protein
MKTESYIKKVKEFYKNSKCFKTPAGNFYIGYVDQLGNIQNIFTEYLIPNSTSEDDAWKLAYTSISVTKNFNRTSPAKMDLLGDTDKAQRVRNRLFSYVG